MSVETYRDNKKTTAIVKEPLKNFHGGHMPEIEDKTIAMSPNDWWKTMIEITGYEASESEFEHESLKDYIYWFTKHGSSELLFGINKNKEKKILLKGLGRSDFENLAFGHRYPDECHNIPKLKKEHPQYDFTKYFVKRWIFPNIQLPNHPGVTVDFIFSIEGDEAKRINNPMLKMGKYTVAERYGVWLCKDYIPIQTENEWLAKKTEWTKYHTFINCQHLELTANRGSVNNTKKALILDIENTVKGVFKEKIESDLGYVKYLEALTEEEAFRTIEQEKKEYIKRSKKARKKKCVEYKNRLLFEPANESETIALFTSITTLQPGLFDFLPLDYNTKSGYDSLARKKDELSIDLADLKYVEFKHFLKTPFNHSFENLNYIVCWNCDLPEGTDLYDIKNEKGTLHITKKTGKITKFNLKTQSEKIIKVFVLKKYLEEKLNLKFQ